MGQGLTGFRGQSMSGQRASSTGVIIASLYLTGGVSAVTGSVPVPATGTAYIFAIGAGGLRLNSAGTGGGAGGAYRKMTVRRGDVLSLSAAPTNTTNGADGADSTVTCPDGVVVRGGGGRGGTNGSGGGQGSGGDINRRGGAGGATGADVGALGEGPGAGAGGTSGVSSGGGGGAAGFGDFGDMFLGGAGGPGSVGGPGGGAVDGASGGGGAGRTVVIVMSA